MAGVKGRSGRRKMPSTIIEETLQRAGKDFPKLWAKNQELALAGDKDALKVWFSYVLGNPKSQTDLRVKVSAALTPEDYELGIRLGEQAQQNLLTEANP